MSYFEWVETAHFFVVTIY